MLTAECVKDQVQKKVEELTEDDRVENIELFSENLMRMILAGGPPAHLRRRYLRAIEEGVNAARVDESRKQKALILSIRGSMRAIKHPAPSFASRLKKESNPAAGAIKNSLFMGRKNHYGGRSWASRL